MTFAKELSAQLPEGSKQDMMQAFREILLNAMEHGAAFDPEQVVEVTAMRTGRAMVFHVRDPGTGFRRDSLRHAAIANPPGDPAAHIKERREKGMRPGGFGLLMASGTVDELIYSEIGNEVLLIKYVDTVAEEPAPPPLPPNRSQPIPQLNRAHPNAESNLKICHPERSAAESKDLHCFCPCFVLTSTTS